MEDKKCINCKHLRTGRHMLCDKKRKNKEVIDIFNSSCRKYEWNEVELKKSNKRK